MPTVKVKNPRTFRKCAGDPVGTEYNQFGLLVVDDVVYFLIRRGVESLEGVLQFPTTKMREAAMKRGPVLHGDLMVTAKEIRWTYDAFGDCVFSSLKSGSYRDAGTKEWGVQDVMDDSIDEIRRILDLEVEVERTVLKPAAPVVGSGKRRILF